MMNKPHHTRRKQTKQKSYKNSNVLYIDEKNSTSRRFWANFNQFLITSCECITKITSMLIENNPVFYNCSIHAFFKFEPFSEVCVCLYYPAASKG